jgi:DNA-binding SARP family transcriptional activator
MGLMGSTRDADFQSAEFIDIQVLGDFAISVDGRPVAGMPVGSQRLLVFLALHDRTVSRHAIAAAMWPDTSAEHAGVSLRSALTRLEALGREAIVAESAALRLSDNVHVDYVEAQALAHRLLDSKTPIFDGDLAGAAIATMSKELLPDWFDGWIIAESEEWRHLRASAGEALADRLLMAGRFAEAGRAARAAIRVDPLRETPYSTLVRIHLADGNQSDALQVFETYRETLHNALELEPTAQLSGLVSGLQR